MSFYFHPGISNAVSQGTVSKTYTKGMQEFFKLCRLLP